MTATEIIKKHGGDVVDDYSLISNWGYKVIHDGGEYDIRRWANCYGSDCGWGVMRKKKRAQHNDEEWVSGLAKDLNDYELNTEW